jgi:hypothetical protein
MDEQPGLSDQYRRSSPWPLLVALGLVLSEIGVVLGFLAITVVGLLLFVGSIAGITRESGYVERPWNVLAGLGVALALAGGAIGAWALDPLSTGALLDAVGAPSTHGIVARGVAIAVAGLLALLAGASGRYAERGSVRAARDG